MDVFSIVATFIDEKLDIQVISKSRPIITENGRCTDQCIKIVMGSTILNLFAGESVEMLTRILPNFTVT